MGAGEMNRHKHPRLAGFDYSQPSAYAFTVLVEDRRCCLSRIRDGTSQISPAGEIVVGAWHRLEERFPTIMLDAFVVMPNHVHGIVFLGGNPQPGYEVAINGDATCGMVASPFMATSPQPQDSKHETQRSRRQRPTPPSRDRITPALGEIVRSLKAASTTPIRKQLDPSFAWQDGYWDRIVRNEIELERYRRYIENNPARWREDREYKEEDS
jgi:REP element-mobilizing transposase RayT